MSEKKVVHYAGDVHFFPRTSRDGREWEMAIVENVLDHPEVTKGNAAYTSEIVLKCEDGKVFETANTIYKPIQEQSPNG